MRCEGLAIKNAKTNKVQTAGEAFQNAFEKGDDGYYYSLSGKFTFNLGYPGSGYCEKEDLRNHPLIISTMKSDGKLMEL